MKKLLIRIAYALGVVWSSPCTLVGLLMSIFYRPQSIRWSEGAIELVAGRNKKGRTRIWGRPGGQTLGIVIWYASEDGMRNPRYTIRSHERVHVLQYLIGSVFFALAYGVEFLLRWVGAPSWREAYRALWWERMARHYAPIMDWGTYGTSYILTNHTP